MYNVIFSWCVHTIRICDKVHKYIILIEIIWNKTYIFFSSSKHNFLCFKISILVKYNVWLQFVHLYSFVFGRCCLRCTIVSESLLSFASSVLLVLHSLKITLQKIFSNIILNFQLVFYIYIILFYHFYVAFVVPNLNEIYLNIWNIPNRLIQYHFPFEYSNRIRWGCKYNKIIIKKHYSKIVYNNKIILTY